MADTVKMIRAEGKPRSADVHPDEVANWKAHGWELAEKPAPVKTQSVASQHKAPTKARRK